MSVTVVPSVQDDVIIQFIDRDLYMYGYYRKTGRTWIGRLDTNLVQSGMKVIHNGKKWELVRKEEANTE